MAARSPTTELTRKNLRVAERLLRIADAREHLIDFTQLTMPHPADPDDVMRSRYDPQYFHRALAAALEEVEAGRCPRLIITFPPRHGKSELTSRRLPGFIVGRDPYRHVILATYNQPFAEDFGRDVRAIMNSDAYGTIFPDVRLRKGSQASDRLQTEAGGMLAFVGRGGTTTGRGADILIVDDPLKDRQEANSTVTRDECWSWFNDVASTRLMSDTGAIILIMTRWHEDDLVGRLTDPSNPYYNEEEAACWKIINIPAIAEEGDKLGRPVGAALWPERFGVDFLRSFQRRNPRGFSALYQQRPTPLDGDFFTDKMIVGYKPEELPKNLRFYAGSDHAVSTKQVNDRTCLLPVGVDEDDTIWILPDVWWRRAQTDVTVEAMIDLMDRYNFLIWWGENEHIFKSIGPFLRKRMQERSIYIHLEPVPPIGDKMTRAQAIQGRMSMGKVRFPTFAPWWSRAQEELLKFPQFGHDDFVDSLAHVGAGLSRVVRASKKTDRGLRVPKTNTMGWIKYQSRDAARRRALNARGGW